ncbi:hypothetical protein ACLKA6_004553 [Drosophila palustris]
MLAGDFEGVAPSKIPDVWVDILGDDLGGSLQSGVLLHHLLFLIQNSIQIFIVNAPPSLLAAACIAAVRQVSGVPKVWTPYLTELTSYTQHMVEPYVDIIILYHYYQTAADVDVQNQSENTWHSPDSGFEEQLSAPQVEVVSVEVETFNIITVQLQKPCKQPPALKRSHLIICEDPESKRLRTDNDPQT